MLNLEKRKESDLFNKFVGIKIKKQRKKIGMKQEALAKLMNCSHQLIQKQESGELRIHASTIFNISEQLGVDPGYFYEGFSSLSGNNTELPVSGSTIINKEKDKSWNILLIEDSAEDAFFFERACKKIDNNNLNIINCFNSVESLATIYGLMDANKLPDLIFLDLNMPSKNGFEVLREIKKKSDLSFIPIIILTNSINAQEMLECYKLGASGYIVKSFDINDFEKKISDSLGYWMSCVATPKNY